MGLRQWFKGLRRESIGDRVQCAATLERIVQLTNPRLRFARRYFTRLAPSVQKALDYAHELVATARPARDASAAAWQSDGYIRAFFATPQDSARAFSRSPEVRAWFGTHGAAKEVYAVLSMQLAERKTLGVALQGDVLKRDVPQTTVCFSDYRARLLGVTEQDLRNEVERRVVDQLALAGLLSATEDRSRRDVLDQERALLRARLRLLENQGAGMQALGGNVAVEPAQLARLHAEIAVNEANLASIVSGPEALDYQVERLREVLSNPEQYFFVSSRRLRLNRQNIVVDESSSDPCETLDLQIARVPMPNGPPELRTFVIARFPRAELLPKGELLSEAARLLH